MGEGWGGQAKDGFKNTGIGSMPSYTCIVCGFGNASVLSRKRLEIIQFHSIQRLHCP